MANDRFNLLLSKIERQTDLTIVPTTDGRYSWEFQCTRGLIFDTEELALIDWINWIAAIYQTVVDDLPENE
jgi:hypothetical protein